MDQSESLKRLFQEQFTKMVAVISKLYGLEYIEIAEDIVSETFLLAAETWGVKGIPPAPSAWLYTIAKQKTLYHFRRNKIFNEKIVPFLKSDLNDFEELSFSQENIKDSQLQMMFAICDHVIASEAQIGLALRILCGFGIDEIAEAFISNKETINKRLFRAKEKLREQKIKMEMPTEEKIGARLDNVLHIIYLLFNEGYYSKTQNQVLQKDLCFEAMRLATLLTEYERTNKPKTNALLALMYFHASRFDARRLVLYYDQDETLWNQELINLGTYYLGRSAEGNELSPYHLEARIAYWHCIKEDSREKWIEVLELYDRLLSVNNSPGVLISRTYAYYKVYGKRAAIAEAEKLKLETNHFYLVLLGELYLGIDNQKAKTHFCKAHNLAKTDPEKLLISQKLKSIG